MSFLDLFLRREGIIRMPKYSDNDRQTQNQIKGKIRNSTGSFLGLVKIRKINKSPYMATNKRPFPMCSNLYFIPRSHPRSILTNYV